MTEEQKSIMGDLRKAIFAYDAGLAAESAEKAIAAGIAPVEAMNVMTVAIR